MARKRVFFEALTDEAAQAMGAERVEIEHFPFRVGRESRTQTVNGELVVMERRRSDHAPNNDLYLLDRGVRLNISREHFQIERRLFGRYRLVDRGSACGTGVGGDWIGGRDRGGTTHLDAEEEIVVGTPQSPYVFRMVIYEEQGE
ncbi:MAG: hypothetical protein KDH88_19600 [Chromatiales bacterium]|nr:hypothetical protein [Chromatiales bacterium]